MSVGRKWNEIPHLVATFFKAPYSTMNAYDLVAAAVVRVVPCTLTLPVQLQGQETAANYNTAMQSTTGI